MRPTLIVTVDTEEEGLWDGRFRSSGNTVKNIRGIPRFQSLCDEFSIRPTYLVDTPVVENDEAVDVLRAIHDDGRCEIGAHLHPWCAPPFEEELTERNSYLCNLPEDLQRAKLTRLTETIEERFARRPTSFRAGRYGLDIVGARILRDLGYLVDSSVIPFTDYSHNGGPNFDDAPHQPYFIDGDDIVTPHASGFLLEVPVSVGFNRPRFRAAHRLRQLAGRRLFRALHPVGIMDRLGIVQRIKLSPEQSDAARMCRMIDAYIASGATCLVMMFHSSSLLPGASPYVPDEERLERLIDDLRDVLDYWVRRQKGGFGTLTEMSNQLRQPQLDHAVSRL